MNSLRSALLCFATLLGPKDKKSMIKKEHESLYFEKSESENDNEFDGCGACCRTLYVCRRCSRTMKSKKLE